MGAAIRTRLGKAPTLLWAGLTLVVCLITTSSTARAGCAARHSPLRDNDTGVLLGFEQLTASGAMASMDLAHGMDNPHESSPCGGALCQGRDVPAQPPTQVVKTDSERWALFTVVSIESRRDEFAPPDVEQPGRPSGRRTDVYHPPRIG